MKTFRLEEYFVPYEFSAEYLLCCSDAESFKVSEVVAMANADDKQLWDNLDLGYTESPGLPALRETIAEQLYPTLTTENVICFSGAQEGIYCALNVLCQKDDHVVVVTPCYQSLKEVPLSKGCHVTEVALREDEQWRINIDAIKKAMRVDTKVVVINFPHNPTGQVLHQSELDQLVAVCREYDAWLFSDEVYHLLGNPSQQWVQPIASCYEKGLSLNVMSKAYGMPGVRIGWLASQDTAILDEIRQFKHYTTICNSAPAEVLAVIALKNKDAILARNNAIIAKNLPLIEQFMKKYADLFSWVRPEGTAIGLVKLNDERSSNRFCKQVIEQSGVLLLPGSLYDLPDCYFRIGFGRDNFGQALEAFEKYVAKEMR